MKFPGKCIVCQTQIDVNETVMWAKGLGVKHLQCVETKELMCTICGGPAGCAQCEFKDDCNLDRVSQLCICKNCQQNKEAYTRYCDKVLDKYPQLKQ